MSRLLESDEDEKVAPRIDPDIDPEIAAWLGGVHSHIGGSGGPDAASGAGIKVEGGAFGGVFSAEEFSGANAPAHGSGKPGSGGHNKKPKTAESERKRKADAARRRRSKDKELGVMAGEVPALREELASLRAVVRNQDTIIDDLKRSQDAKVVKGFYDTYSHSENVPGLNECVAIVRNGVPNVHALVTEINSVYCSPTCTIRTSFGHDLQERVGERFLWTSKKCHAEKLGFTPHLNSLVEFVEKGLGGRRFLRGRGAHGRGVQLLDTGDWDKGFDKPSKAGPCIKHRDYDGGRLNSYTIVIFLHDDCLGFPLSPTEDHVEFGKAGDIFIFPTSVYHFGCGHGHFNGSPDDMGFPCRRIFMYMDLQPGVLDRDGQVISISEVAMPSDYKLEIVVPILTLTLTLTLTLPLIEGQCCKH